MPVEMDLIYFQAGKCDHLPLAGDIRPLLIFLVTLLICSPAMPLMLEKTKKEEYVLEGEIFHLVNI